MKNIILIGMKGCGKSTVGTLLAKILRLPFVELDTELEKEHEKKTNKRLTCREIFAKLGGNSFRELETETLNKFANSKKTSHFVLACGGGTPLAHENQMILSKMGTVVLLNVAQGVLLTRIVRHGIPAFFPFPSDPKRSLSIVLATRIPIYKKLATLTINITSETPKEISKIIAERI